MRQMNAPLSGVADAPPCDCDTRAAELLAGLITHQNETGAVGRQLVYILLGAGVTPALKTPREIPLLTSQKLH